MDRSAAALPAGEYDTLVRMGQAFGDPTRRLLYRLVVEAAQPVSAGEVAQLAGLHRTVARTHLERLVEAGMLQVRLLRGPKGGRPAKGYLPVAQPLGGVQAPRRYQELAELLLKALLSGLAGARAADVAAAAGFGYGRRVAKGLLDGRAGDPTATRQQSMECVQEWLNGNGYRASQEDSRPFTLTFADCPFSEVAAASPEVVCALDAGLVSALLGVPEGGLRQTSSIARGDAVCRFELVL